MHVQCMYMYMYTVYMAHDCTGTCTITCIVHHNLKERKKRTEKKERRITHYKIDNNLNGLEKYSLIFGEQPQWLRKINICNNLNVHVYMHIHVYVHVCILHVHVHVD